MSRSSVLFAALAVACVASAQLFNFPGMRQRSMPEISGTVRLEPKEAVVGIPCSLVFQFDTKSEVKVQQIAGLPDHGVEYLAEAIEPYADGTYRLPVRFLEPVTNALELVVSGMQTVSQGAGTGFVSSYSTSFQKRLPSFRLDVRPLPTTGRPQAFAGAVGTKFRMTQTLAPDHVRPGDLVTATYRLAFDGYCPSNTWPSVDRLSKEFKAYAPKQVSRTEKEITWTQVLVPRTTAATNSALVSLTYYNPHLRRYEVVRSEPKRLVFVSDQAASTKNTSVLVADPGAVGASAATDAQTANTSIVLRFAPSESSLVLATLAPGTPLRERARVPGWRRVETPRAIGWMRWEEAK